VKRKNRNPFFKGGNLNFKINFGSVIADKKTKNDRRYRGEEKRSLIPPGVCFLGHRTSVRKGDVRKKRPYRGRRPPEESGRKQKKKKGKRKREGGGQGGDARPAINLGHILKESRPETKKRIQERLGRDYLGGLKSSKKKKIKTKDTGKKKVLLAHFFAWGRARSRNARENRYFVVDKSKGRGVIKR